MTASGFLHNMARMVVSTLLEIGLGKREIDAAVKVLDGREEASAPAAAQGLFLQDVLYLELEV